MATFIGLINWTDQGVANFRDTTRRAAAFGELVGKHGGTVKDVWWCLGQYDLVTVVDMPDEASATAVMLEVGSLGNVRTTTVRAFDAGEMQAIIDRTG